VSAERDAPTATATARRAEIVAKAARLFDERGYHETSLRDIAAASGLHKASLYHYFAGKAEILYAIHDEFMDAVLDAHEQRARDEDRWDVLLRGALRDIVQVTLSRRGHIRIAVEYRRELAHLPAELQRRLADKRARHYELVKGLVRRGVEEDDLDTDVTSTAFGLLGMAFWTYQWARASVSDDADTLADRFFDLAIEGARRR
jgi:TetR/AcrR family transcriptional regulator, cholesterol catabolism regulator